ncbi:MAG: hypothetical protein HUJ99_01510 [Bacteroidaceae bacterium]|nr:hypothetical protein [Bacteroidaceae bacterium]
MRVFFAVLICLSDFTFSPAQTIDRDAVAEAIQRQMELYPESTLQDIYKHFFQDSFGPGHIIPDRAKANAYLMQELESASSEAPAAAYELLGWRHLFYRVDLSVVKSGTMTAEKLLDALVRSANDFVTPTREEWAAQWAQIELVVRELCPNLPNLEEESHAIAAVLKDGDFVLHHSDAFNEVYAPHYRIIAAKIVEEEFLTFKETK